MLQLLKRLVDDTEEAPWQGPHLAWREVNQHADIEEAFLTIFLQPKRKKKMNCVYLCLPSAETCAYTLRQNTNITTSPLSHSSAGALPSADSLHLYRPALLRCSGRPAQS